jgi:hypothetical protein
VVDKLLIRQWKTALNKGSQRICINQNRIETGRIPKDILMHRTAVWKNRGQKNFRHKAEKEKTGVRCPCFFPVTGLSSGPPAAENISWSCRP